MNNEEIKEKNNITTNGITTPKENIEDAINSAVINDNESAVKYNINDTEKGGVSSIIPDKFKCPNCDFIGEKDTSVRMHAVRTHSDEYKANPDKFGGKATPPSRKKTTQPSTSRRDAVTIEPVKTEFTPAEADEVSRLKREIEVLKLENQRKQLNDSTGKTERKEREVRQRDENENQVFGLLRDILGHTLSKDNNNSGNSEELSFWRAEAVNLRNQQNEFLREQLQSEREERKDLGKRLENLEKSQGRKREIDERILDLAEKRMELEFRQDGQSIIADPVDNKVERRHPEDLGILDQIPPELIDIE